MRRFEAGHERGVTPGGHRLSHAAVAGLTCLLAAGLACDERPLSGSAGSPGSGGARATGGSGPGISRGTGGAGEGEGSGGSPAGSGGRPGGMPATGGIGPGGRVGTGGAGATSGSGGARPATITDVGSLSSACVPGTINPGRSPLRRLSRDEYLNSVHDLVPVMVTASSSDPFAMAYPAEVISAEGFSNDADVQNASDALISFYSNVADEIANAAAYQPDMLAPSCDRATMGMMACATSFIGAFGEKAFRRPLTAEEVASYQDLFVDGSDDGTYEGGIASVISAMLQSPYFLYRVELGRPDWKGPAIPLTSYEIATKLSYFVWGSIPDATLLAAADADQLTTPAALQAQVQRMVTDPRARQAALRFHREWLELDSVVSASKDESLFPEWNLSLATDLLTESETFADRVFWEDGNLKTLFSAPFSYVNGNLAAFYGVAAPADPTSFTKVDLNPTQRAGILTRGAFLAGSSFQTRASASRRGTFIRDRLLCQPVPQEPPGMETSIPPPAVVPVTARQQIEMATVPPQCAACHRMFDPIGFGLGNFDALGRWQATDNGLPIDASGEIVGAIDPSTGGPFNGPIELMRKLASSGDVRACVAAKWFRWSTGRAETLPDDACSLLTINKQFQNANYDMRAILPAIVTTDAFRYRSAGGTP